MGTKTYIFYVEMDILAPVSKMIGSMSISTYKIYVLVPITLLPEPITLGSMGNGTPIIGIGILQCIFHTGDNTLTIHAHCYHVPNDCANLLSPQRVFSTCGGATGNFTIGDNYYTLSLNGKPSFQIRYDSKSYIHFPLYQNDSSSDYLTEVNLSVLYGENIILTPYPKLVLLWHQNFGHRNMQSIQHLFFHVHPFTSFKITGAA